MATDRLNDETARMHAIAARYPENESRVLEALHAAARAIRDGDTPRHLAQRATLDAVDLVLMLEAERVTWENRRIPREPVPACLKLTPPAAEVYRATLPAVVAAMSSPRLFVLPGADGMIDPDVVERLAQLAGPASVASHAAELAEAADEVAVLVSKRALERTGGSYEPTLHELDKLARVLGDLKVLAAPASVSHPSRAVRIVGAGVLMAVADDLLHAARLALEDFRAWFPLQVLEVRSAPAPTEPTELAGVYLVTRDGRTLEVNPGDPGPFDPHVAGAALQTLTELAAEAGLIAPTPELRAFRAAMSTPGTFPASVLSAAAEGGAR